MDLTYDLQVSPIVLLPFFAFVLNSFIVKVYKVSGCTGAGNIRLIFI